MAFNPAITTDQYVTLRGSGALAPSYQGATYLSLNPNTIIFQALVNQVSFASSFAVVTYDTVTTGAYTDLIDGMTLLISPTTDLTNPVFVGRVRANNSGIVATSTTINLNETSADVQNNYVITAINDFRIWDRLGRQVNTTQYVDYEITYHAPLPLIYNLNAAYANWVSGGVLTLNLAPSALAVASGASISSWLWTVGDGTITSGSTTTQDITVTFPPGFRYIYLRVTDSNGNDQTRRIAVFAHDPDVYPPVPLQAGDLSVSAPVETGYSASIAAWAGVEDVLDNTLVVMWTAEELYQDGTTSFSGNNIALVGRLRSSSDTSTPDFEVGLIAETRYTIESPLQTLSRLEMLPYEFDNAGSPTKFFQVKNLTLWRAVSVLLSEFSTFLTLHSLSFDSTSDAFLAIGLLTQGNNILAATNDLYFSVNGAIQMDTAGNAQCVRDLRMVSDSLRNAAVTVGNWIATDILSIESYDHPDVQTVGRLTATGGSFSGANNQYTTFESLAPGLAQNYPEGSATLDRQVLTANQLQAAAAAELNARAGFAFARAQETDKLTVTHPDGYYFLVPALDAWYTFTLDGSETVRGIVLTTATRWLLVSVDLTHDSVSGQRVVKATYTRETTGAAGQEIIYPPAPDSPYVTPSFPPFDLFPAFPIDPGLFLPPDDPIMPFVGDPTLNQTTIALDGNTMVVLDIDNSVIYLTQNLLVNGTNPTWADLTPPNVLGALQHIRRAGDRGLYAVSNNGTDSRFHYLSDCFDPSVSWVDTDLTGKTYDFIRSASADGSVDIVGETSTPGSCTDGWVISSGTEIGRGEDYIDVQSTFNGGVGEQYAEIHAPDIDTCVLLSYEILTGSFGGDTCYIPCGLPLNAGNENCSWLGSVCANFGALGNATSFSARFHFASGGGCGDCAGTTTTDIATSTDFGASFGTPQSVAPMLGGQPGFDLEPLGEPSLIGTGTQVMIAPTLGGAYTPYGIGFPGSAQPNAIVIPRYTFGSTSGSNVPSTTPEFLVGSGTLSSGSEALWKVTNSGSLYTAITPTRSGVKGLVVGPDSLWMPWLSGKIIAEIATFSGTPRFCVTVNTGTNWKFTGALDANARAVTMRKNDQQLKQAFFSNGSLVGVITNYQAATLSYTSKTYPGGLIGALQVWG